MRALGRGTTGMRDATAPQRAVTADSDVLVAAVTVAIEEIQLSRRVVQQAIGTGVLDVIALREHNERLFDVAAIVCGGGKQALAGEALDRARPPTLEAVPDPGPPHRPRHRKAGIPRQRDRQQPMWPRAVKGLIPVIAVKPAAALAGAIGVVVHALPFIRPRRLRCRRETGLSAAGENRSREAVIHA